MTMLSSGKSRVEVYIGSQPEGMLWIARESMADYRVDCRVDGGLRGGLNGGVQCGCSR